jgi:hypothetical protein
VPALLPNEAEFLASPNSLKLYFPLLDELVDARVLEPCSRDIGRRRLRDGRGWDRTSDLPRVKRAQMGTGGD